MADFVGDQEGAVRAAETLLRGTGGRAVLLRRSRAAAGGDEAEQLGLSAPSFDDVELRPCRFRKSGARDELLVSALAVQKIVGSLAFDSAAVLFKTAVGLVVDGIVLEIEGVSPVESGGVAVCYRVGLKSAVSW